MGAEGATGCNQPASSIYSYVPPLVSLQTLPKLKWYDTVKYYVNEFLIIVELRFDGVAPGGRHSALRGCEPRIWFGQWHGGASPRLKKRAEVATGLAFTAAESRTPSPLHLLQAPPSMRQHSSNILSLSQPRCAQFALRGSRNIVKENARNSAAVVGNGNGPLVPQLLFNHAGAATVPLRLDCFFNPGDCTMQAVDVRTLPISTARAIMCPLWATA